MTSFDDVYLTTVRAPLVAPLGDSPLDRSLALIFDEVLNLNREQQILHRNTMAPYLSTMAALFVDRGIAFLYSTLVIASVAA